ncbi:alpha/beta fold hydrolase [Geodermatophilus marinus]|uniref:alpha/beta fold hydrolase n=1 Tax=Geodermatophilus sp. LHW52908 TaxID=2303986 RepID=UPI000E3C3F31|nr:alpha/beta fold hydrolase [Geodermatophilus sp. LHW52908]RFU19103.1 alpha/beta fold hydrolase [Geodermatophilus sp. LHW52908]
MGAAVRAGEVELWVEQRGAGPDVLLLNGGGDPLEAWQAQLDGLADRYRLTAFDNRDVGRSTRPGSGYAVADLADDAAGVLRACGIDRAHVAGYSGGGVIAQELALRHPDAVRSLVLVSTWARPDVRWHHMVGSWLWMAERAPSERAFLEAFFAWTYTHGAHEDGRVDETIEAALAFPHKQSGESFHRFADAFWEHATLDRLPQVAVPTLVLTGSADTAVPPAYGRAVADAIPGATFELIEGQAHAPFEEVPEEFNRRLDAFWREVA